MTSLTSASYGKSTDGIRQVTGREEPARKGMPSDRDVSNISLAHSHFHDRCLSLNTGVVALQALRGDAVWRAMQAGSWDAGGWEKALFEACLCRSQTLAQPATFSDRHPTADQIRQWVKDPAVYRFEYADGLKATMLLMNGLVEDFTFAARIKGLDELLSTLFYLPPNPNVVYSAALMSKAEELFLTGRAPYPLERTLLTTGLVAAGMQSLAAGQKRLATPHLEIRYQAPRESLFSQS